MGHDPIAVAFHRIATSSLPSSANRAALSAVINTRKTASPTAIRTAETVSPASTPTTSPRSRFRALVESGFSRLSCL